MRLLFIAVCLATSGFALAAGDGTRSINLDAPGALEALARDNPAHFQKVQVILDQAARLPMDEVVRTIRTRFDGRDVEMSPFIRTVYPARTSLSFVLDGTQYRKSILLSEPVFTRVPYQPR